MNTRDSEVKREKKRVFQLENIKKVSTKMKKVFMMVALVLTCTTGSLAQRRHAPSATTSEMKPSCQEINQKRRLLLRRRSLPPLPRRLPPNLQHRPQQQLPAATTDSSKTHSADTVNTKASARSIAAELWAMLAETLTAAVLQVAVLSMAF